MNCHALHDARRIATALLLCLLLSGFVVADVALGGNRRSSNGFGVEGLVLGMGIDRVLDIYPDAQIERSAANCYSYGRAVNVPELTSQVLRYNDEVSSLTMNFAPPYLGGKLSRIHYDRSVDLAKFDITDLIDGLSEKYGAYDRILYRRKMEPSGRIVGFEWRRADGATLRVELRNDYRNNGDSLRLSFLARSPATRQRPAPRALSQLCAKLPPNS